MYRDLEVTLLMSYSLTFVDLLTYFMVKVKAKDLCFPDVKAKAKDTVSSRTFANSKVHHSSHCFM